LNPKPKRSKRKKDGQGKGMMEGWNNGITEEGRGIME